MKIAIIDAEIVFLKKHRFPNLAAMKISGYHKSLGDSVELITEYNMLLLNYDRVYISKVFTDTEIPEEVLTMPNVSFGGSGFHFPNEAPPLPYHVEHHMPDYHLYDTWVGQQIENGCRPTEFEHYKKYSIGYRTRYCFRKCSFCINQHRTKVEMHSPVQEFYNSERPYLLFLDDNFLGHNKWEKMLQEIKGYGKKFVFKQGLDIRLLDNKKAAALAESNYKGDYIFAFDNIRDKELIIEKLSLWRSHTGKRTKLYVLCGYNEKQVYGHEFWIKDIGDVFERVFILAKFDCVPYIMRHKDYNRCEYKTIYSEIASWCNQPWAFRTMSYREYCIGRGMGRKYKQYKGDPDRYLEDGHKKGSAWRWMEQFEKECPGIAEKYFDVKFQQIKEKAA